MIEIYTDGSCSLNSVKDINNNGKGGFGVVVVENGVDTLEHFGCYSSTTNNRMELRAVLTAMEIANKNFPNQPYTIYSDSAYVVNCFENKWYENWLKRGWKKAKGEPVLNTDLWKPIIHNYHKNKNLITIKKVEGHAGVHFNERADTIANKWRELNDEDFSVDQK